MIALRHFCTNIIVQCLYIPDWSGVKYTCKLTLFHEPPHISPYETPDQLKIYQRQLVFPS